MLKSYLGISLIVAMICFEFVLINGCAQTTVTTTTTTTIPAGGSEYFPNTDGYQLNYTYTSSGTTTSGSMVRKFNGTQTFNSILCQKFIWSQDFASSSEVLAKVTTLEV